MKLMACLILLCFGLELMAAVNLNTASVEELTQLKGIGKVTAEKIVEYREKYGFKDIREVINIKGVGEKKFDQIKDDLTL